MSVLLGSAGRPNSRDPFGFTRETEVKLLEKRNFKNQHAMFFILHDSGDLDWFWCDAEPWGDCFDCDRYRVRNASELIRKVAFGLIRTNAEPHRCAGNTKSKTITDLYQLA
jgi:hypothetical protein